MTVVEKSQEEEFMIGRAFIYMHIYIHTYITPIYLGMVQLSLIIAC
jgi:hypothetical protein